MIGEAAWREARDAAAPLACVYAKAILAGCANCSQANRRSLAERETVGCASAAARRDCVTFLEALRARSAFALKLRTGAPLAHAAAMKLQCGGLDGLSAAAGGTPADVHARVAQALAREREGAPPDWPAIVAAVARREIRPRRKRAR